jgi:hypothetical protein
MVMWRMSVGNGAFQWLISHAIEVGVIR